MSETERFEGRFERAYRAYLNDMPTQVDAVAIAHAVATRRPAGRLAWPTFNGRGLVWVAILALSLLALAATFIVGSYLRSPRHALHPTGIELLNRDATASGKLVTDGSDVVWGRGGASLTRIEANDEVTVWTIADDAAFNAADIAASHRGGVWLLSGATIQHFDGKTLDRPIEAPREPARIAEDPNGSLWVAYDDGQVARWTNDAWVDVEVVYHDGTNDHGITGLATDENGQVWVTWVNYPGPDSGGMARYDGTSWKRFVDDDPQLAQPFLSVSPLGPTDVWATTDRNVLWHYDGQSWASEFAPFNTAGATSVVRAADGSVFLGGSSSVPAIGRYDGSSWTVFGPDDGLTSQAAISTFVTATSGAVYAATSDGVFTLADGRWRPVRAPAPGPVFKRPLIAASADDIWVSEYRDQTEPQLWHFAAGQWQQDAITEEYPSPSQMTIAPNGAVWAAGQFGVAQRIDDSWRVIDATPASALAFEDASTIWVVGADPLTNMAGRAVWVERLENGAWRHRDLTTCPIGVGGWTTVLPDGRGGAWVGVSQGWFPGGLAHYDGTWRQFNDEDGTQPVSTRAMSLTPSGELIVVKDRIDDTSQTVTLGRVDANGFWTALGHLGSEWSSFDVAPDGTIWRSTSRGPARFDGTSWTYPFAETFVETPLNQAWTYEVAQDGRLLGFSEEAVIVFPRE